jgi:bacterioferritin-associated ferredoxin
LSNEIRSHWIDIDQDELLAAGNTPLASGNPFAMFICLCHAVTDREIRATVSLGAASLSEVSNALGVGTSCGRCREQAESLIADCRSCPGHGLCGGAATSH